jgi:hypothetical protein
MMDFLRTCSLLILTFFFFFLARLNFTLEMYQSIGELPHWVALCRPLVWMCFTELHSGILLSASL